MSSSQSNDQFMLPAQHPDMAAYARKTKKTPVNTVSQVPYDDIQRFLADVSAWLEIDRDEVLNNE